MKLKKKKNSRISLLGDILHLFLLKKRSLTVSFKTQTYNISEGLTTSSNSR